MCRIMTLWAMLRCFGLLFYLLPGRAWGVGLGATLRCGKFGTPEFSFSFRVFSVKASGHELWINTLDLNMTRGPL